MKKNKNLEYYLNLPYKIELYYEPVDNTWVATHPELGRGSCYAIGTTQKEALKLLEEAKKEILEYALSKGHAIPEPKFEEEVLPSGQFVVRLPRTLHKKLKDESDRENISLNQLVSDVLSEYVGEKKVHALYKPVIESLTNMLFERVGFWHNSHFQIFSPILEIENKENYNKWLLEELNVEEKTETPEIDWRYFSSPIPRILKQSSNR